MIVIYWISIWFSVIYILAPVVWQMGSFYSMDEYIASLRYDLDVWPVYVLYIIYNPCSIWPVFKYLYLTCWWGCKRCKLSGFRHWVRFPAVTFPTHNSKSQPCHSDNSTSTLRQLFNHDSFSKNSFWNIIYKSMYHPFRLNKTQFGMEKISIGWNAHMLPIIIVIMC